MRRIAVKAEKEVKKPNPQEQQEDYYKGFRSAVVLVWMFCNFALAAVVLSAGGLERVAVKDASTQRATIYMAVVLWSVAGLSLFRFCGAVWFLIVRLVSPLFNDSVLGIFCLTRILRYSSVASRFSKDCIQLDCIWAAGLSLHLGDLFMSCSISDRGTDGKRGVSDSSKVFGKLCSLVHIIVRFSQA